MEHVGNVYSVPYVPLVPDSFYYIREKWMLIVFTFAQVSMCVPCDVVIRILSLTHFFGGTSRNMEQLVYLTARRDRSTRGNQEADE